MGAYMHGSLNPGVNDNILCKPLDMNQYYVLSESAFKEGI